MTQYTYRLCKGYLTKKESDWVPHQMTWPLQSPDLTPIEMVWDELDTLSHSRVKEKHPTTAQHMCELLQDCWKSIPGEASWENAKSVQSYQQGKRRHFRGNLKSKIYLDLFNTVLVTTWFYMCYFIVLMSSLLFYNVEIVKKKAKTVEWVGVFKLLTGTVYVSA